MSVIHDGSRLEDEMYRLTGGYPNEFVQRFREVWDMPYIVVPTPWVKIKVIDPHGLRMP